MPRLRVWTLALAAVAMALLGARRGEAVDGSPLARTTAAALQSPDAETVRSKIRALDTRDDTVSPDERPEPWLRRRRDLILPQIIEGVRDPSPKIALACLSILSGAEPQPQIAEALLLIAADPANPVSVAAMLALVRYPSDERAARLMAASFADETRFPKPLDRARLAAAGGVTAAAIVLLEAALNDESRSSYDNETVEQLGRIGAEAIPALERVARSRRWHTAATASVVLEKVDPKGHPLTADQRELLASLGQRFKGGNNDPERLEKLAALDRQQVQPLVMQALERENGRDDALGILTLWNDQAALPAIKKLIATGPSSSLEEAIAAYLSIEGGPESDELVLGRIATSDHASLAGGALLRAILTARMSDERRLDLLSKARALTQDVPCAVPLSLRYSAGDKLPLLGPLMDREANLLALSVYAESAGRDQGKRFARQLVHAVRVLAEEAASTPKLSDELVAAAHKILTAASAYALPGVEKQIASLIASPSPSIRLAARVTAAKISGTFDRNVAALLDELGSESLDTRRQVFDGLIGLELADPVDRGKVEARLLGYLGTPREELALRLLARFGGDAAVRLLMPMLDGDLMSRSVLAAWVLPQIAATPERQEVALRRFAIYALFHHENFQQGSGVWFRLADGVYFQQRFGLPTKKGYTDDGRPVELPPALQEPFPLAADEQSFAIRAYRWSKWRFDGRYDCPKWRWEQQADASFLPLLRVIAAEDPELQMLYVKGEKVAHFNDRQCAAREIARITGEPASYTGLAGEAIDSGQMPAAPYQDQNLLIARFVLDRIAKDLSRAVLESGRWNPIASRNALVYSLAHEEQLGEEFRRILLAEVERRGLTEPFRKVHLLEQWR